MKVENGIRADLNPDSLIAQSRVAAVVSDPRLPDNPIVACNEAFVRLTGYPQDEVVGRNCRFLRGPATEVDRMAILREAVATARPSMVELTNYRKDGTPFINAVMIAPLFDEDGRLLYFLGSQMAVEDETNSASARASKLVAGLTRRQRQILEAVSQGKLNKQIAYEFSLTERTVKLHRAAMLRGLGVRSMAEAIRIAIEAGL